MPTLTKKTDTSSSLLHKKAKTEDFNRVRTEFIAAVSHELRTPLSITKQLIMNLFGETVGPLNNQQREILVRARHNIDRLENIIYSLLEAARIERKTLALHLSLVDLCDLFRESEDYFKQMALQKNIQLTYDLPKKEINLLVDPEKILQVSINLINNAIKFSQPNGRIKVEVKVEENKVRVGVIDNGIGIAPADISRIFERFVQVVPPGETKKEGLGLGLSIAKEIVEKHGGTIWVESLLGDGSKFYFTLPRLYTMEAFGAHIHAEIQSLLAQHKSVYLVNLLIVNYERLIGRIGVREQRLSRDFRILIESALGELPWKPEERDRVSILSGRPGNYSVIFPEELSKKVTRFSQLLKEKTKNYLLKHHIEHIFIAVGIASYPVKKANANKKELNVQELYIGSEMRCFKRIRYETDVEVILAGRAPQHGKTVNLSKGGLCYVGSKFLKIGTPLKVRFNLLRHNALVKALGRVAWNKRLSGNEGKEGKEYMMGVEFKSLDEDAKGSLSRELKLYYA